MIFFAVNFEVRQFFCPPSGGDHNMFSGVVGRFTFGICNHHFGAFCELRSSHDDRDFVLFHQELNAFAHSIGYVAAAFNHTVKISLWLAHFDAVFFCMVQIIKHLCAFKQCFGGNTAPVETDSAKAFAFDDGDVHTQLGGAYGSYIPARAATDDNQIKVHVVVLFKKRAKVVRCAKLLIEKS